MEEMMTDRFMFVKWKIKDTFRAWKGKMLQKTSPGIDGILVTVGLCIIALVLCVVMKDSLTTFIKSLVADMQIRAGEILKGSS